MVIGDFILFILIKTLVKCLNFVLSREEKWSRAGTPGPATITERAILGRDDTNPGFDQYYN